MRFLVLVMALVLPTLGAPRTDNEAASDEIVVTADGAATLNNDAAAAEEEAIWDAKRNAVEQAVGVFLRARSVGRDFHLEEDEVLSRSDGFVRRWEVVQGSRRVERVGTGRLLRLQVRAAVALLPVIHRLADIRDVYEDLERPRLRVMIEGDDPEGHVQNALVAALKAEEFEVAVNGPSELVLTGRLESTPTVRLGDSAAPYDIGSSVAACRTHLSLRVISEVSEEVVLSAQADGVGESFQSDAEARAQADDAVAGTLLNSNNHAFIQSLLVRWAHERQEGHVVAVQATGLDAHHRALLSKQLEALRGFRRIVTETVGKGRFTVRFLTRSDTRTVRRRLAAFRLDQTSLTVLNSRGPLILCAAVTPPRLSSR